MSWHTRSASFFRTNAVNIGVVTILLATGTILFLLASTSARVEQQQVYDTQILNQLQADANALKSITGQLASNATQRTEQIDRLSAQMNCIVLFFSSQNPDRTDKAITDINNCTITTLNNPTKPVVLSPSGASAPSPIKTSTPTTTSGGASATQPAKSTPAPAPTPKPSSPTPITNHSLLQDIKNLINGL
jgi:hypothetical protein